MSIRRPRHPYRVGLLLLVVLALAAADLVIGLRAGDRRPAFNATTRPPLARVVPPGPAGTPVTSATQRRSDALTALLATRANAVLHRDRGRFLATVDTSVPAFRRAQQRLFDALSTLRFASWSYELDAPATGRRVPDPVRFRGATELYAPRTVVVLYRLASYDAAPTSTRAGLTFLRRGTRWLLAADSDFDGTAAGTQREIWDFGPLTTVAGPHTLVIGLPSERRMLGRLRTEAERDIPLVSSVWGRGWPQRVAIVVPANQRQLATIVNKPYRSLSRIAAVATAELGGSGPTAAVGNRILVNPANVDGLGALGWHVVMTHEITHVATRAVTAAAAPTWLVEGFADYVAYRSTPVPDTSAAPDLTTDVRAGQLPSSLPADQAFTGTNPKLAQAYEQAWLAVRLIATRTGTAGLLRFYRAVAASPTPVIALRSALNAELGVTPAGFVTLWRAYLRATLS